MDDKTEDDGVRKLDSTTASMDPMQLNNLVVSMRPTVKKCKVYIINKLVKKVRQLRWKKGTEDQLKANIEKADRLGEDIMAVKTLVVDRTAKKCLANTIPFSDYHKQSDAESRALLRVATHDIMTTKVNSWREGRDDWKSLAAYLLYKNTGRRYKKAKNRSRQVRRDGTLTPVVRPDGKKKIPEKATSKRGEKPSGTKDGQSDSEENCEGSTEDNNEIRNSDVQKEVRKGNAKKKKTGEADDLKIDKKLKPKMMEIESSSEVEDEDSDDDDDDDDDHVDDVISVVRLDKDSGMGTDAKDGEVTSDESNENIPDDDEETEHVGNELEDSNSECSEDEESEESGGVLEDSKVKPLSTREDSHSEENSDSDVHTKISSARTLQGKGRKIKENVTKSAFKSKVSDEDEEMVVKKFSIDCLQDDAEELDFLIKSKQDVDRRKTEDVVKDDKKLKKKDSFFWDSDLEKSDSDDQPEGKDGSHDTDVAKESSNQRFPRDSMFVGTLSGTDSKSWQGSQYQSGDRGRGQGHERGQGFHRGQSQERGRGYSRGQAYDRGQGHNRGQGYSRGQAYDRGQGYNRGQGYSRGQAYDRGQGHSRGQGYSRGQSYDSRGRGHSRGHEYNTSSSFNPRGGFSRNSGREHDRGGHFIPSDQHGDSSRRAGGASKPEGHIPNKRPAADSAEYLHPSWAASKRRREQLAQIQSFQGKKTTFDD